MYLLLNMWFLVKIEPLEIRQIRIRGLVNQLMFPPYSHHIFPIVLRSVSIPNASSTPDNNEAGSSPGDIQCQPSGPRLTKTSDVITLNISSVGKCSTPRKMDILRCMGSKFRVKFQRAPLKFHTQFWTHTPQNRHLTVLYFCVWVTISLNCDVISLNNTGP